MEAAGDDDGKTSAALQAKSAKGFPRVILAGRDVLGGVRFWGRAYEIGALGFSLRRILLSRLRRWRHYDISASVSGADFMIGGTYGRRRPRSAPRRRSLTDAWSWIPEDDDWKYRKNDVDGIYSNLRYGLITSISGSYLRLVSWKKDGIA